MDIGYLKVFFLSYFVNKSNQTNKVFASLILYA